MDSGVASIIAAIAALIGAGAAIAVALITTRSATGSGRNLSEIALAPTTAPVSRTSVPTESHIGVRTTNSRLVVARAFLYIVYLSTVFLAFLVIDP
jgi:hypothetical protein